MPWKDNDPYNKIITQYRIAARNAIIAHAKGLKRGLARRLDNVAERVRVEVFLPVVYRVDLSQIDMSRRSIAGSGLAGSREYLVADLCEDEFDLLFMEDISGTFLAELMRPISPDAALATLEVQCQ